VLAKQQPTSTPLRAKLENTRSERNERKEAAVLFIVFNTATALSTLLLEMSGAVTEC
jgi:hypothetical protein